jgi:hypothetical protein
VSITPELQLELETLLVKQTLHELIARFSRAADRLDAPSMAALFHPDATIDSGVLRGHPEYFAAEFVRWVQEHARVTFHAVSSELFQVDGTVAKQREGQWKFSERRFVLDYSITRYAD